MKDRAFQITDTVRQTAYEIHRYFACGHLEKVYENALAHRLRKAGLNVKQQHPLVVRDEDGTIVGEYYTDLLVDEVLIIELKAAKEIANEHVAQLLGYLRASRIEHGALLNFGAPKFQIRKLGMRDHDNASSNRLISSLLTFLSSSFLSFGQ
jgi:GxxExxY protein